MFCVRARLHRLRKNSRSRYEPVERTFRFATKFFQISVAGFSRQQIAHFDFPATCSAVPKDILFRRALAPAILRQLLERLHVFNECPLVSIG